MRAFLRTVVGFTMATVAARSLAAQEGAPSLTGCYDVTEGAWLLDEDTRDHPGDPIPYEWGADSAFFQIPPRIQLEGDRIVGPRGALPTPHPIRYMRAAMDGPVLKLGLTNGFFGVAATLDPSGEGWTGTAETLTDFHPHKIYRRPVQLSRVPCDSPPPVSVDAMRPLARTVELEGGEVIRLTERLPESLETAPRPSGALTVVGRTRGLFGATDSIAVMLAGATGIVAGVQLIYLREKDREAIPARMSDVFGVSDSDAWQRYCNRSTYLIVLGRDDGTLRITLQDRRYRSWSNC